MNDYSQRPKTLLALDIGTHTGWMIRLPDGEKHHGSWKFPSGQPTGNRMLKLYQSLFGLLKEYDCMQHDVRIAVEVAMFSKNPGSQVLGNKFIGVVELMAATYGFLPPTLVTVQEWRNPFLKLNGFLASPRPPKGTKNTSQWYKDKTIEQCNRLGLYPENDNIADAIGIGWWFFDGGRDKQKERKKAAADKKQQKKAQTAMDLK